MDVTVSSPPSCLAKDQKTKGQSADILGSFMGYVEREFRYSQLTFKVLARTLFLKSHIWMAPALVPAA